MGLDLLGRSTGAIWLVAVAAVGTGCGGGSLQPAALPERAGLAAAAATVFPSRAYQEDGRVIARGEQQLIRQCMARRGFAYPVTPPSPEPPPAVMPAPRAGYGLFAEFRRAGSPALQSAQSTQARYVRTLSRRERTAYLRALEGSPRETATLELGTQRATYRTSGCAAHATTRLYGGVRRYYQLVIGRNAVATELGARLEQDRRLADATASWRKCMARQSLPYATPEEARNVVFDAYLNATPGRVRARERATAAADRACALQSHVYEETARAEDAAVRSLGPQQLHAIEAFSSRRKIAAKRARRLVARLRTHNHQVDRAGRPR